MQCPVPEDRLNAWYRGICSGGNYDCCFNEINTTCCYAYGSNGPIKCCGIETDHVFMIFGIIMLVLISIAIICLLLMCVLQCYVYCKKESMTSESTYLYSVDVK